LLWISGNGNIKTETRSAQAFNQVEVSGNIDVYVKQDSVASVKVVADDNLLEYILTENDNGTIYIHNKKNTSLRPSKSIKVYVSGPALHTFKASGACTIYSENKIISPDIIDIHLSGASDIKMELKAPKVKASTSGAGSITLSGETKDFEVDGSGSSDIKSFDLMTENTKVGLSGAGDAEVFASVSLDVHVSGAADVKYKGNPSVNKQISGAGSVKKVD